MEIQAVSQVSRSEQLNQQAQSSQQASPSDNASSADTQRLERAMTSGSQNSSQIQAANQAQQSQVAHPVREAERVNHVNQVQVVDGKQVAFINETQAGQCTAGGQQDGCLGDTILNGLDKIRQDSTDQFKSIELALSGDSLNSAQDMLRIQYEMNVWALKQELFAKTAGGFDRSIDTLLKSQ